MYNPFDGQANVEILEELVGRQEQISKLRGFLRKKNNAALFGPENSGKTALLNSFFNADYRKEMAKAKTLIYVGDFPTDLDGEKAYAFFVGAIRTAISIMEFCGMRDEMNMLLYSLDDVKAETNKSRFDSYLNKINNAGYRIIFVLDNFENFTSSPAIKTEHHDLLCGLINDFKLQLVVATNFDFNETSLPEGTRNSLLLTRLDPNSVVMTGFTPEQCRTFLDKVLEEEYVEFRFSDDQVCFLHELTGGFPLLLNNAAKHAFNALNSGDADNWEQITRENTMKEAVPLFKRWCKVTPDEQLDLLANLPERVALWDRDLVTAGLLEKRGLLLRDFEVRRDGRHIKKDGYIYNCGLFRAFCHNPEWMEEVRRNNPLRKVEAPAPVFDIAALMGGNPQVPPVPVPPVNPPVIPPGSNVEINIYNGPVNNNQSTVLAAPSFEGLLSILSMDRQQMGTKLLNMFHQAKAALPPVIDTDTAEIIEAADDQAAQRISAVFIPEEVESENMEQYQQEQKTLEDRFNAVRASVDPDGYLDDALLNSLSVKCRMYLQIAVVVDDAMEALSGLQMEDLSAQMVMYGKVLEQCLRDNLYELFSHDENLRYFDSFAGKTDRASKSVFANMNRKQATIGSYIMMLQRKSGYLQALCRDHGVSYQDQKIHYDWWKDLGKDTDAARNLRNKGAHPGSETTKEHLVKMRRLLIGEGNILRRCVLGDQLTEKVLAKKEPDIKAPPGATGAARLIGMKSNMFDAQVTQSGGLQGKLQFTGHEVVIDPKHLTSKKKTARQFAGKTVSVQLTGWDDSTRRYTAELC